MLCKYKQVNVYEKHPRGIMNWISEWAEEEEKEEEEKEEVVVCL